MMPDTKKTSFTKGKKDDIKRNKRRNFVFIKKENKLNLFQIV